MRPTLSGAVLGRGETQPVWYEFPGLGVFRLMAMHSGIKWTSVTPVAVASAGGRAQHATYRDLVPVLAARCANGS